MAHVLETSSLVTMEIPKRLAGVGIRAYVPVYAREVHHARRVERREYPLYGRYIFAWFNASELRAVLKCKGVVGVLRRAGSIHPATVDDRLISAIGIVTRAETFEIGESVRVRGGNWDGLCGLFHEREERRITLMLSMLGRDVPMDFDVSQVIKNPHKEMSDAV